jgi:hypothetical protein
MLENFTQPTVADVHHAMLETCWVDHVGCQDGHWTLELFSTAIWL